MGETAAEAPGVGELERVGAVLIDDDGVRRRRCGGADEGGRADRVDRRIGQRALVMLPWNVIESPLPRKGRLNCAPRPTAQPIWLESTP